MNPLLRAETSSCSERQSTSLVTQDALVQEIFEVGTHIFQDDIATLSKRLDDILERCLRRSPEDQVMMRSAFDDLDNKSTSVTLLEKLIRASHFNEEERGTPYTAAALKLIQLGVRAIHSRKAGGGYHDGYALVHVAAEKGNLQVLQALGKAGVDLDAAAVSGLGKVANKPEDPKWVMTPLSCCVEQMSPRIHRGICKQSADIFKAVFDYLVAQGADPKKGYICRNPILHICIDSHLEDWAWSILDRSEIDAVADPCKDTPLFLACAHGMEKLAGELLRRGANPDVLCKPHGLTQYRLTPLHVVVLNGDTALASRLLDAGADPNKKSINPFNEVDLIASLPHLDPLSAFQLAVDLLTPRRNTRKMIQAFLSHSKFPPNTNVTVARTIWNASQPAYGRQSLPLRMITETVRAKGPVPGTKAIRCFSSVAEVHERIAEVCNILISKDGLGGSEGFCRPIVRAFCENFSRNSELAVYFVTPEQFREIIGDDLGRGCYNPETGDHILVATDFDTKSAVATLIHEATHMLAHQFYQLSTLAPKDPAFHEALKRDKENLESCGAGIHTDIRYLFSTVKSLYPEDQWPSEYLARIPEAALRLALLYNRSEQEIDDIFKKSIPNLYQFFQTDFLPRL